MFLSYLKYMKTVHWFGIAFYQLWKERLNSDDLKKKKTYADGNPCSSLRQAQTCGEVKPFNERPTFLLITGSSMAIQI
jgi:hypothetical protein